MNPLKQTLVIALAFANLSLSLSWPDLRMILGNEELEIEASGPNALPEFKTLPS
jgi:hypothetical protein